jgi:hypothetical protein
LNSVRVFVVFMLLSGCMGCALLSREHRIRVTSAPSGADVYTGIGAEDFRHAGTTPVLLRLPLHGDEPVRYIQIRFPSGAKQTVGLDPVEAGPDLGQNMVLGWSFVGVVLGAMSGGTPYQYLVFPFFGLGVSQAYYGRQWKYSIDEVQVVEGDLL